MYYQETNSSLHSRSHSMPESAYYTRVGARSRRNIVSMMSPEAPSHWRRLREPLTVDCSVEYDLGASARVPKDSAPLLIIHPAYASRRTPSNIGRVAPLVIRSAPPVTRHASFVRRYPYQEEDFRASMPDIRARVCLKQRLETAAAFADSGLPSSSAATLPLSSNESGSSASTSADPNRTIRVDSGIGSPSSSSSEYSASSKKWRNGVSGLVTGFFCCSAIQPPPKNEEQHPWNHHPSELQSSSTPVQSIIHHRTRLSLPSSSFSSSSSGSSPHQRHPNPPRTASCSYHQRQGGGIQKQQSFYGQHPSGILKPPVVRRAPQNPVRNNTTCQRCRLSNSSVDCRDGFCSSIWNKENNVRPIQI